MNDQELTRAVWQDLAAIEQSSTLARLHEEYDKERRKKKVGAETSYLRYYPIRTKAKNNWIIFLLKSPEVSRYRNSQDISFYPIVYYFGPKGFTVFKPDSASGLLFVFQGHVFTRYCQRMQLSFSDPLEKIRHFFTHNAVAEHQVTTQKNRLLSIGICRDGALLGEYRENIKWVFNRTFVNREVFRRYQHRVERQIAEEPEGWAALLWQQWNKQDNLKRASLMMKEPGKTLAPPFLLPTSLLGTAPYAPR